MYLTREHPQYSLQKSICKLSSNVANLILEDHPNFAKVSLNSRKISKCFGQAEAESEAH